MLKRVLIVLSVLILSGCSLLTLAYNRLPTFAYWRIDGIFDLTEAQSQALRPALESWHAWHRQAHLPQYAATLQRWQTLAVQDVTPAQVCTEFEPMRQWVDEAAQQMIPVLAPVLSSLSSAQIDHWNRHQSKRNDEFAADFGSPAQATVNPKRLQRAIDRAEMLYGALNTSQRDWLASRLAQSQFDVPQVLAERQSRHLRAVTGVERIQAGANAQDTLRELWQQIQQSPNADYAAYSQRMVQDACEQFAQLHNQTTPMQRQQAVQKLKGYERDILSLAVR